MYQFGLGYAAVLQGIVQQGSHQGLRIESPFGALAGYRNRVCDVGLPAIAQLAQVGLIGKAVGQTDTLEIAGGQVVKPLDQVGETGGGGVASGSAAFARLTFGNRLGFDRDAGGVHPANIARRGQDVNCTKKKHRKRCFEGFASGPQRGTFLSISIPIFPAAISRSAVTPGLFLLSTLGACPWLSIRAR